MIRRPQTIAFWWERLPHWEVEGGRYFVTIHLAGAIPIEGQRRLREMGADLRKLQRSDDAGRLRLQRMIFSEMERWLDHAPRVTHLQRDDVAAMVIEAIEHRHTRETWCMLEYVVMPTHLHLFCELGCSSLKDTIEDFKRWTGHRAARLLSVDGERFWQREWFDHWSRSGAEDEKIAAYIRDNPVKARLVKDNTQWPHGSWSRSL